MWKEGWLCIGCSGNSSGFCPAFLEEMKCRAIYNYYFPVHTYAVGVCDPTNSNCGHKIAHFV